MFPGHLSQSQILGLTREASQEHGELDEADG